MTPMPSTTIHSATPGAAYLSMYALQVHANGHAQPVLTGLVVVVDEGALPS